MFKLKELIDDIIKKHKITQSDIARATGISRQRLDAYRRGISGTNPVSTTVIQLKNMCKIYGMKQEKYGLDKI